MVSIVFPVAVNTETTLQEALNVSEVLVSPPSKYDKSK